MRQPVSDSDDSGNAGFQKIVDGFLLQPRLPFAQVLNAEKIVSFASMADCLVSMAFTIPRSCGGRFSDRKTMVSEKQWCQEPNMYWFNL